MNPAEGGLRPQLLDRFGLMVNVVDEANEAVRVQILGAVLAYETARALEKAGQTLPELDTLKAKRAKDQKRKQELIEARDLFPRVVLSSEMAVACVRVGKRIQVEGHRGDYIMALASRANAALHRREAVLEDDLIEVAPLAMQHRRPRGPARRGGALDRGRHGARARHRPRQPARRSRTPRGAG